MTGFGGAGSWLWDLALQDDGRIVAAGMSGGGNSGANFALARYNTDGSLNGSFSNDGMVMTDFFGYGDEARSVALQEDGGIVAAGITYDPESGSNFAVARYFGRNDATPPEVTRPAHALITDSTLGTADVPVRLSWSPSDSDVTRYDLQQSTDGAPYENVPLPNETATSRTVQLSPGHDHRFRVRAWDENGNGSFWEYGRRFALDAPQETDSAIAYAKTWKTQSSSSAYDGKLKYSTVKGAKATLGFTGTEVAWVAPESKARGKAVVYLDGAKVATVDLSSKKTLDRRVVFSEGDLDPATPHELEIKNLGTSGRPRVDVDAFVVLR